MAYICTRSIFQDSSVYGLKILLTNRKTLEGTLHITVCVLTDISTFARKSAPVNTVILNVLQRGTINYIKVYLMTKTSAQLFSSNKRHSRTNQSNERKQLPLILKFTSHKRKPQGR